MPIAHPTLATPPNPLAALAAARWN